jgi:hypothetical protein
MDRPDAADRPKTDPIGTFASILSDWRRARGWGAQPEDESRATARVWVEKFRGTGIKPSQVKAALDRYTEKCRAANASWVPSLDVDAVLREASRAQMSEGGCDACGGTKVRRSVAIFDRGGRLYAESVIGACGCSCPPPPEGRYRWHDALSTYWRYRKERYRMEGDIIETWVSWGSDLNGPIEIEQPDSDEGRRVRGYREIQREDPTPWLQEVGL